MTHSVLKLLCIFGAIALMGMISLVPAAAQDPPAPAIDGITIDSYDCETGNLLFHVAVTDLPHIPDSNGPLGLSVIAHYEQGTDDGMPASGFNPDPEDSPYTGDVQFTRGIAPDGADSASEDTSGSIQSIDISVIVVTDPESGPTDTASTTYDVACEAVEPAPSVGDDAGDSDTGNSDGDADDPTTELPDTGAGAGFTDLGRAELAALLSGAALLLTAAALRLRRLA